MEQMLVVGRPNAKRYAPEGKWGIRSRPGRESAGLFDRRPSRLETSKPLVDDVMASIEVHAMASSSDHINLLGQNASLYGTTGVAFLIVPRPLAPAQLHSLYTECRGKLLAL